ncbi:hypothetical protein BDZ89DRAFT_752425 [Hymenopellis radicata]|nr:hypothetical protein BDZ89DRAFT_752425 [Hymenopellis radicata]
MAGTNHEGIAVVLRVISKGEEGKEHLRMLRRVATGLESLVATNHMLPIWNEIVYDDVVCTVSPMVGPSIRDAFEWKGTSTGDVLDMVQQALEGLSYLHGMHIMHRDAFVHNFLLQWLPESLIHGRPSVTRPRVYIIDLECALELGPDCAEADYLVFSPPIKDRPYTMPTPPEATNINYNSLKGDMWQFGWSLRHFSSRYSAIDDVLREMASDDPSQRPSSHDAHERLRTELGKIPPNRLHTRPLIHRPVDEDISHLYQVWKNNGKAYMG